jgi:hypothetical protein
MKFTPELIFKEKSINNVKINNSDKSSITKELILLSLK